jgi:steroid delta-isomerase-like uncharacterized protein
MSIAQDNATIAQKGYDAYNSRHSDPRWLNYVTDTVAEDCEVVDVPSGATFRGPEGLKQFLLGFSTAFPDSSAEVTNLFATEDGAVVEFLAGGTHTGPLHGPAGDIPPTGRSMKLQFCDVYKFRDGKIVSHRTYYDALGMLQQLGLVPAMG